MQKKFLIISLVAGGFFLALCFSPAPAMAATNMTNLMSPSTSWGWNPVVGWINFNTYNDVTVSANNMVGFASSSAGPISLDCGTPGICSAQNGNYTVLNASGTAEGNLSGWAWNDKIGWITFFWEMRRRASSRRAPLIMRANIIAVLTAASPSIHMETSMAPPGTIWSAGSFSIIPIRMADGISLPISRHKQPGLQWRRLACSIQLPLTPARRMGRN